MESYQKKRIYLDHAATSFPKPSSVVEAVSNYMSQVGASAGRGAYREAFQAKKILDETRALISEFFDAPDPHRVVFSLNATEALNLALKGILREGDHAVVSSLEHNSVSRPLFALQQTKGLSFTTVKVSVDGEIDFQELEKAIQPKTRLIAFVHGSNVSGTLSPIAEVGERARQHGIPFLVDAAQTAGSYPLDVDAIKIDLLACPGHKGLLGPLGTGFLWVRSGIELQTLKEGGTGSFSEEDRQPATWPDLHESGSHNQPGIEGLKTALEFLRRTGLEKIRRHKVQLLSQFLEGLRSLSKIKIIAPRDVEKNAGVVSLQFEGMNPMEAATRLDEQFRIQVRPGLHCSPWAHRSFGSYPVGTVRFSFGFSNTSEEVLTAIDAVRSIIS